MPPHLELCYARKDEERERKRDFKINSIAGTVCNADCRECNLPARMLR